MQWISHPIFNHAGILSIGYGYPNLFMSERYNGPGSPYWGLKTFFMLALSDSHPFWTAPDRFPVFEPIRLLTHPHMLVVHENDHAEAFVAGQHCQNHGCVSENMKSSYIPINSDSACPEGTGFRTVHSIIRLLPLLQEMNIIE